MLTRLVVGRIEVLIVEVFVKFLVVIVNKVEFLVAVVKIVVLLAIDEELVVV